MKRTNSTLKPMFISILLLLLALINGKTQDNFIEGYIINNNSDTIIGQISYDNWQKCPDYIFFRNNEGDAPVKYFPLEIVAFSVNDMHYFSSIVDIETTPTDLDNLDSDPEFRIIVDTVFLQSLILGKKSLYRYAGNFYKEQFYIYDEGEFKLLLQKQYRDKLAARDVNGMWSKNVIRNKDSYKGMLMLYLGTSGEPQKNIEDLRYNRESLEDYFIRSYRKNQDSEIYYTYFEADPYSNFGVRLSLAPGRMYVLNSEPYYMKALSPVQFYGFSAGVYFNKVIEGSQRRKSLLFELNTNNISYKRVLTFIIDDQNYSTFDYTINYSFLNLATLYRYSIPTQKFDFYIQGGPSVGFLVRNKTYIEEKRYFYPHTRYYAPYENKPFFQTGGSLVAGLVYKKYTIETRYEAGIGFDKKNGAIMATQSLGLGLGYWF